VSESFKTAPPQLPAAASGKEGPRFGRTIREKLFVWLLRRHYERSFRRLWHPNVIRPHFTYHRLSWFFFGFGTRRMHPYQLIRAFYAAEALRPEDIVLDIGSGDGFFTNHFLSAQSAEVDAIDVDPMAIEEAKRNNSRPNIAYYLRDAVKDPFPRQRYDVIVFNGAIGHLSVADTKTLMEKIAGALPDGVFVGSESLGREGYDHLQQFETTDDMARLFQPYFSNIWMKALRYPVYNTTFIRNEAYWRCANSSARLAELNWSPINSSS
jgi:SAM-dependent methyltransferase